MNSLEKIPDEVRAEVAEADKVLAVAKTYTITTPEMFEAAGEQLREIKSRLKSLEDREKAITRPINAGLKAIRDFFRTPKAALEDAERYIKRAMSLFHDELEAKRRTAEAEAQERARKEREKLEARAAKAAENGHDEKSEILQMQAASVLIPTIPSTVPRPSGVSMREVWTGEVTDKMALIRAVAAGKVPDVVLQVNMTVINQQARSLKDALSWPGVCARCTRTVTARSA